MFTHSLRWRLQLWLAVLLTCVLSAFGAVVYQLQQIQRLNRIDEDLSRRVKILDKAVRGPLPGMRMRHDDFKDGPDQFEGGHGPGFLPAPYEQGPPPDWSRILPPREFRWSAEDARLFEDTTTNTFYYAVWFQSGALAGHSPNAPTVIPRPEAMGADTLIHTRTRGELREMFHFTEMGDCVLAGRSITEDKAALHRFCGWLFGAGGIVLALGLGVVAWLTSRAIRPVEEISAAAGRISEGNLSERIEVADPKSELGRLAGVLNSTFVRLEAAFARQTRFTADASHELRTPLAIIISEAQTTLARERNPAEYRETIKTCLETAQQMRRLTESLLELARSDVGRDQCPRSVLDLGQLARAGVEQIHPLAEKHGIRITCNLASAKVFSNADRLAQVVANLLANAIQYNKPNGEVGVATRCEADAAILIVSDTGQGISAEDLPHIFERFYRADKSRTRADGRSGLGLSICKAIIDGEGGSLEVSSRFGAGTIFTVKLPGTRNDYS